MPPTPSISGVCFMAVANTLLKVAPYHIVKARVNILIEEWLHKSNDIYIMEFYYNLRCYQCLNIDTERTAMSKNC